MKLALGTVQFGLQYGITNKTGQIPLEQAHQILTYAAENKIQTLDTAPAYGQSEEVLGKHNHIHNFRIITKTPKLNDLKNNPAFKNQVENLFYDSLNKLNLKSVYGLLAHDAEDLTSHNAEEFYSVLAELKQNGLVQKIGVSVYSANQIDKILSKFKIDLIQVPVSVLDQRLILSGNLKKLKKLDIEIHVRSAFLQGVLLSPINALHNRFAPIVQKLESYHATLKNNGLSSLEGALLFLLNQKEIDQIVVGVTNLEELKQIVKAYRHIENKNYDIDYSQFASQDENIVNPSLWR